MAFKFRCAKCGKRLTVNESPGSEVTCPHCNQVTAVPPDAEPTELPGTVAAVAPEAAVPDLAEAAKDEKKEGEEEEEEEQEGGVDSAMGWLALYLPSWGTSFVLHVLVVILAIFIGWAPFVEQAPFVYKSEVVSTKTPKLLKRQLPKNVKIKEGSGRGKYKPGPSSIVRIFTDNPFPDVASNNLAQLEVIGVGGGGNQIGGFEGLGNGRGGFFGVGGDVSPEGPRKIVYIVDRSGSMTDSIDYVKYELKRSIGALPDEKSFHIIFYSSGPPVEMPTRRLVDATERNKQLAFEFVDSIIAQGETDPSKALERAFACGPELIYLLTDGEFDRQIIDLCKRLNTGGKVTIHTIGFLYKTGEEVLKQIANDNGGNYKFVSEADLATLSQQ